MKTPLDCQLLTLGLEFVRSLNQNNLEKCFELIIDNDLCRAKAEILVRNGNFRSLTENFTTLHAQVSGVPKVLIQFLTAEEQLFDLTLICSTTNGSILIRDLEHAEFHFDELIPAKRMSSNGLTGFDMMDVVVPFSVADAVCDTDYAVGRMSTNVEAFGIVGHDAVVKFKDAELAAQKLLDEPAYKLEDPFVVDFKEELVSLGFECVMATKPGVGTDFVSVDAKKLVSKIHAVRH